MARRNADDEGVDRFSDDLRDVPPDRRAAARRFLRADHAAGRLVYLSVAGILALGSVVFGLFAVVELFVDGVGAGVRAAVVPVALAIGAVIVARRPSHRFTEMDIS